MVVDVVSVISWLSGDTGIYIEVPHACCKSILNVFPINPQRKYRSGETDHYSYLMKVISVTKFDNVNLLIVVANFIVHCFN
jgi:hypothetical protein